MANPPSPSQLRKQALDNAKAAKALSEKYPQSQGATNPVVAQPAPVPGLLLSPVSGPPAK